MNPIMMHAEGFLANGGQISRLRRGAFEGLLPVLPVWQRYNYWRVSPDGPTIGGLELSLIMFSEFVM